MGPTGRWVLALAAVWAGALGVNRSLRRVRGPSMQPTLHPGDLVLALPVRRPRRGEVVLLRDPRDPDDPSAVHVKRVAGLAGDRVELGGRDVAVPAGHVAVLGDARDASTDSRVYGPVPLELVLRRVPLRCWPRPTFLTAPPAHAPNQQAV